MTKALLLLRAPSLALLFSLVATSPLLAGQGAPPQTAPAQPPAASDVNAYYTLGPDSLDREGVPKGVARGPLVLPDSKADPGTQHT